MIEENTVVAQQCYCDPTFAHDGCNESGCLAIAIIFMVLFLIPLVVCVYRLFTLPKKSDNVWSAVSHSFIAVACVFRVIRSACLIARVESIFIMAILFLFPIGFLICSYFNTLFVWIKIIYHFNFSKLVEKIFPFLGKTMIGSQVLLMVMLIICSATYWPYWSTNLILGFFILYGALGFAIFGKMIWSEYKDLSNKDCGVFSQNTHNKIQRVTKLSAAAIIVTFCTFMVIIWSFIQQPLSMKNLLAFNFVGRAIEVSWMTSMLLVLSPSLQTGANNTASQVSKGSHLDDLSDSSIDIEEPESSGPTQVGVTASSPNKEEPACSGTAEI
ncbi:hypothetical protein CYY_003334 [Polysphondylium violaceum]|uniref:Uncharacterized protein n=1 Tax=Polysphondylium violaceum TaxID=133409 RepID=A0A8J4V1C5_9MYCE|nr:hypothetical protein CYY_003334 [Polysphondylium violaceum]